MHGCVCSDNKMGMIAAEGGVRENNARVGERNYIINKQHKRIVAARDSTRNYCCKRQHEALLLQDRGSTRKSLLQGARKEFMMEPEGK